MKAIKIIGLFASAALFVNAANAQDDMKMPGEKTVTVGGAPSNGVIHVIDHVVLPK